MAQAAMAAGSGLSAVGDIAQGNQNANISDYNAQIANQSAAQAEAQGAEQARRALVQGNKVIGSESAAYGASGVGNSGSAMDVLRSSAANNELNALTIKNGADVKATAYQNEAALDQYRASNDTVAGYMNAAGALLGGGAKMAMSSPSSSGTPSGGGGTSGGSASAVGYDVDDYEEIE